MGQYTFAHLPEQFRQILAGGTQRNTHLAGIEEEWNIPVALWHAPSGFEAVTSQAHHTLAFVVDGATDTSIERVDGRYAGRRSGIVRNLTIHPDGEEQTFRATGEISTAHLYLTRDFLISLAADTSLRGGEAASALRDDRVFVRDRALQPWIDAYLSRALDTIDAPSCLEMDARAVLIGLHLLRHHSSASPAALHPSAGGLAAWQIRRTKEYVAENLAQAIRLEELAATARVSSYHFCRGFKASTGLSPHRYQIKLRIERAKDLLATTRVPIAEVAAAVGYEDPNQLARVFRKDVSVSPSRYRREQKR